MSVWSVLRRNAVRSLSVAASMALLANCSPPMKNEVFLDPLVVTAGNAETADHIVVVVPGALSSIEMYAPVEDWADADTAIVAYRLPGLDGLPLDRALRIDAAGRSIARYVNALAPKAVYLIGFSVGGPVVIEAAKSIEAGTIRVALISTARPAPAVELALPAAIIDLTSAAIRAGKLERKALWKEYYRTLLFGRDHFRTADRSKQSEGIADQNAEGLLLPTPELTRAHGASLATWALPQQPPVADPDLTLFQGAADTVFPLGSARRFAARIGADRIFVYPGIGHLLFLAAPRVFQDIRHEFGL